MDSKSSRKSKTDTATTAVLKPQFIRVADATRYCGLSRSLLYEHLSKGDIESKLLRKPGHKRGIRLISVLSLDQFLESLPEGGQV